MHGCGLVEYALRPKMESKMREYVLVRSVAGPLLIVLAVMFCGDALAQRKNDGTARAIRCGEGFWRCANPAASARSR
jgi:hypothetical protein